MTDLAHLERLARDRSTAARQSLAAEVADLYVDPHRPFGPREIAILVDILRTLVRDTEIEVRRTLARRLAAEPSAPREVVLALANDEFVVAEPVLANSPVLDDADLTQIVRHHGPDHRRAVAGRPGLGASVADALTEAGEEDVLLILIGNRATSLARPSLERLIQRGRRAPRLHAALLERPELGPDLASRLYWWVSSQLRERILATFAIDRALLDQALGATVAELTAARGDSSDLGELARHLSGSGAVTPALLAQVLRQGALGLFVTLFARRIEVPEDAVARMIREAGGESLALACRAAGIDKPAFVSIFLLSRCGRPGDQEVDPEELSEALHHYDRATNDRCARALAVLRGATDHPAAPLRID